MAPAAISNAARHARSLIFSAVDNLAPAADVAARSINLDASSPASGSPLGPLAARSVLVARDGGGGGGERGLIHPAEINNNAIFALFGIIGAGFVVTGIWFFFWAKNGGFYFKKKDWDDYKTTVLRRRGPNGTILSGATPTTDLGGGSVYKDVYDDGTTATEVSDVTGITGGVSDVAGRERRKRRREKKERERERKKAAEKSADDDGPSSRRRRVGEDGALIDPEAEREAKSHLRSYRHEKAARVGGINAASDGSAWDGSTNNPTESNVSSNSDTGGLLANRERTPTTTPTSTPTKRTTLTKPPPNGSGGAEPVPALRGGGIRKVYSTADRNAEREAERIRAEARKLQEKGRAAVAAAGGRRDFSYQRAEGSAAAESAYTGTTTSGAASSTGARRLEDRESRVPGSWAESDVGTQSRDGTGSAVSSDVGTKSYRHRIPGLPGSGADSEYADERRKKRAGRGYRRGGDEYTDVSYS